MATRSSETVMRSRAKAIAAGAVRIPTGLLPQDAAAALEKLLNSGWGTSRANIIAKALITVAASIDDTKNHPK